MKSSNKIFNSGKIRYVLFPALIAALVVGISGSCSHKRSEVRTPCDDGGICPDEMFCVNGYCSPTIAEAASFVDGSTGDSSAGEPYSDLDEWLCESNQCGASAGQPACAGCMIGACYKPGLSNPTNACEVCYPAKSATAWSPNSGAFCDDKKYCTQGDRCAANQCDGTPVDCSDKCDCTKDSCSETQAGCVNSSNCPAGKFCDCATNKCGQCGATQCIINGVCHDNGFANPTNACQVCDSGKNAKAWTLKGAGTPCGSATGNECASQNACDSAGKCIPNPAKDGTACGDKTNTECHDPDTCIDGQCISNYKAKDVKCGDEVEVCEKQDYCDGSGKCVDRGFLSTGASCGNSGNVCQLLQCNANHECKTVKVPYGTQCGTIDQCNIKQCNANGNCNVQVKLDTASCNPDCTGSETRCSGKQPQKCNGGKWKDNGSACTNGCSNGACNPAPAPECTANKCINNNTQARACNISTGKWGNTTNCTNGCTNGTCNPAPAPECTANRCINNNSQARACNVSTGKWGDTTNCTNGCTNGTCNPAPAPECTENQCINNNTQARACNVSTGKWGDTTNCTNGCTNGTCNPAPAPQCTENQCINNNTQVHVCNTTSGQWSNTTDCQNGQVCKNGECQEFRDQ